MPRPRLAPKKKRATEILMRLHREYPDATCSLDYQTPVQLLVATILSAQCTDERVNQVTPALFDAYPDAEAMASAEREDIEALVKSTGFYRNKAKHIQGACHRIVTEYNGKVPQTMEELLTLPGVARKTANVVLANAFGINRGVTVDTHVKRLCLRFGLTKQTDPGKVERDLMKLLPQKEWENWSIRVIYHGRAICPARKPRCEECCLSDLCASAGKAMPKPKKTTTRKITQKKSAQKGKNSV
ncbi:MAG: endonuclease III [Acaryochloridaceae cyanobacterium RL_2_7]|nr:endonuclease III [Acaryochloridaceae cyanobacterium RL_2_7]